MKSDYKYYCIYKPFGMLSQFSVEGGREALSSLDYTFPKDVYPVGRLDADSEGLLLLTNNKSINAALLDPEKGHWREYAVQVDGQVTEVAGSKLSGGVFITIDGKKYLTKPCKVKMIDAPAKLPERNPPVRFRKEIPTSWMSVSLKEGKNRQVRKMTAAVGFPTLRLVRVRIGKLDLPQWIPGAVIELSEEDFFKALD